ncbi:outer membrane protein [Vibrio methylphosphonaticus]|uniref:outer membrane protein n=1 Tax=Vibrio methylphosphonaticus TaxID=2946866 RepID=UPI00202A75EC|nr:porin family protein [Vibrio methylphosphonaticus]MCL9774319.1 porin family protein [Vibrio methylphosphonaticus]
MSNSIGRLIATFVVLITASPLCSSNIIVTPFIGYSIGGTAADGENKTYDISPSSNLALAVEFPILNGRIGAFYSQQNSSLDTLNLDSQIQYLQLQSSAEYQVANKTVAYIGAGLGASHISADWTKSQTGFAASIFGGIEYQLVPHLFLNGQARWQGTVVSNESISVCNLPTNDQSCFIGFNTQWMNQFQTNIGVSIKF